MTISIVRTVAEPRTTVAAWRAEDLKAPWGRPWARCMKDI